MNLEGSTEEKLAEFLGEITNMQVHISDLERTAQGHSKALISFGEHILPVPSQIKVCEGLFRDEAELVFICNRSNDKRSYFVHAASKWMKWAAIGCTLVKGAVDVSVGSVGSAMGSAQDLKELVDDLDKP